MGFITEVKDEGSKPPQNQAVSVYCVEDAVLPTNIKAQYAPLPPVVPIDKVLMNIVNNIDFVNTGGSDQSWFRYFNSKPSRAVMSDTFWYCICWYFKSGQHAEMEKILFDRISVNYVGLFTLLEASKKDFFFKFYADAIAQAVLYSMFLAYPKSRVHFTHKFRQELIVRIAYWTTGIKPEFISTAHWKLDLGGGDVLQSTAETGKPAEIPQGLKTRAPRPVKFLCYSPLVEHFLMSKKFESQNFVRPVKIALTSAEARAHLMDQKHQLLLARAHTCRQNSSNLMQEYEEASNELKRQEKVKVVQTRLAKKRLEIRRKEVLRGDPHEYANYLVSLNILQPQSN
eukprot:GEMP01072324.1.p1 GENE.GEMP01072324.1~~GEMP01072324.1.p1  ORF type:complete len:342 (+),score=50.26 GEMP01072324.1:56-1081(+)